MSSLNGTRGVSLFSHLFSVPRLFLSPPKPFPRYPSYPPVPGCPRVFEEIMRQRIRAVSRNSARQRPRRATGRSSTRYIRLRRFLRSHSYPCENDKTDGALLLKSHRVSRIRDAEIYESCRPILLLSPFLIPPFILRGRLGDDLFRADSYHRVSGAPPRLFDGRYRIFDNVLRSA